MKRREFLMSSFAAGALISLAGSRTARAGVVFPEALGKIMTVLGPIEPDELGLTLPHEHIMSQFGAEPAERPVYDEEKLFAAVIPYLSKVRDLGCQSLADCTTAYFGRSPLLLRKISQKTGVHVLTNAGIYGAANDRYIPEFAFKESAQQLADRWAREMREGIEGTGIRPGFIKIGVDGNGLSEIDAKLVRAGARAHLQTGLVVEIHTGDNVKGAKKQLEIFREEGVHPEAWVWVHAHKNPPEPLLDAAEQGAWIELDGVNKEGNKNHLALVNEFKKKDLLNRVLLSHDGNSFRPHGRPPKAYEDLFTTFIPLLKENGYSQEEIDLLTIKNPREAFTIKVRRV